MLNSSGLTASNVKLVPLYRFLILPGHDFQNYPSEVQKPKKPKVTESYSLPVNRQIGLQSTNIIKWMMSAKSKTMPITTNTSGGQARWPSSQNVTNMVGTSSNQIRKSKTIKLDSNEPTGTETHLVTGQYRIF